MKEALCSVVIPMFNCAGTIRQAVRSAQDQTYGNLEILTVDDRSSDETPEIVKKLAQEDGRIRILRNETNLGAAESRNRAFGLAKGKFVALLDGDDVWEPDKLKTQTELLEKSGCGFCYTSYSYIDIFGNEIGSPRIVPEACSYSGLLKENFVCCSSVLLRAELTGRHKMTQEFFHEDFVYWLELLRSGCTAVGCNQVLVKYRVSKTGRSGDKRAAAKNRWRIYRNYCKMNAVKSACYFSCYAFHGLKKYRGLR